MRVLVVGSGGRARARSLCWALSASPLLTKLWCAPGNPGIAQVAETVPIGVLDFTKLVAFARDQRIDLVVPGPRRRWLGLLADAIDGGGDRLLRTARGGGAGWRAARTFTKRGLRRRRHSHRRWRERFDDAATAHEFVRRGAADCR